MPEKKKTTMSVTEMRKLLGLKKTDSYWLVHKNCFETIMVNGKMRIVIDSFEKWYANQIKHKKVDGPPPGEELKAYSYSVRDIAQMLSIDESSVYYLIKRDQIPTFKVETWTRIRKDDFEKWYASQNKHRTKEDREKDAQLEAETMTMPEMARELYISRKDVYNILSKKENSGVFDIVVIADKKRITRASFERWYAGQSEYRKLSDRTPEELAQIRMTEKKKEAPRLEVDPDKPSYNVRETAVLMDLTPDEVRQLIRDGKLAAKKYGATYIVRRETIDWWTTQQKLFAES
ncbi:MAG: helix-turn-helix domain-containing protein [Eubacterium sp.]|nr:helix-turn-helix domain-containing protein [Eubacterium sp.]